MTVRERVLASRLIQKIDGKDDFAQKIGISYLISGEKNKQESKAFAIQLPVKQ